MDTEQRASSQAEDGQAPRPGGVARYTRKGLLGRAGGAAAGITAGSLLGVANAEAARVIPRRRLAQTKVTVMWNEGELSKADIEFFEGRHPNIKIDFIADDPAKLAAMIASGSPPDMWRVQGPAIPSLLSRGLIRPLTTYFQQSDILRPGDLAPANNYYKSNGRQVGAGQIYGMVKDWSPDFNIFINRAVFRAANVPVPSAGERLTYTELKTIAAKLTRRRRGGRPVYRGFAHSSDLNWFDRTVMNMIAERGKALYANNFTRMNLTKNAEARKVFQFFFDMHKRRLDVNPLLPSSSWDGVDFTAGKIGMIQYGYWFGGMAESKVTKGKVVMLPAPTWGRVRRNPTITATGGVISSRTQNPDAAWEVFEFYMGGKPARDRAASGWGVPALKSMYDLIPNKTAFDKQRRRVLLNELALNTKPLQFNPYLSDVAVATTYKKHVEQALRGRVSFSEMLQRIEREVNGLIESGRRR
jgi:multiple sugar transport system substrate-binding protein